MTTDEQTPHESTSPDAHDESVFRVVDRPDEQRYELLMDGAAVSLVDYHLADGVVTIPHVETHPAHRGKDFAARAMAGALDDIRARGLSVRPLCSYAAAYFRRHPETHDLLDRVSSR